MKRGVLGQACHAVAVGKVDQGAQLRARVVARAQYQAAQPLGQRLCHLVKSAFMDQHPGDGGALLARHRQGAGHQPGYGGCQRRIGPHNGRRLAAEFQRKALERAGGIGCNALAGG